MYLRQTPNELTGEHSCIMLRALHSGGSDENSDEQSEGEEDGTANGKKEKEESTAWLREYWKGDHRVFAC